MSDTSLTLLAISDLHYTGLARQTAQLPQQRGELALTLLKKVFLRLHHMDIKPDLAIFLGDLVENGSDRNSELDMISLNGEMTRSGIPFLSVPGNHDGDMPAFNTRFDCQPGFREIGGYGFLLFNDSYGENHECVRSEDDLALTKKSRRKTPASR